ncbi:hypothetical protein, partial [Salmonella sp. SAL00540]|uniref:hypothetical protein n=1 Tax=Salmonella sp. SAL00540 TaxID=3160112 RepID=UPI003754854C
EQADVEMQAQQHRVQGGAMGIASTSGRAGGVGGAIAGGLEGGGHGCGRGAPETETGSRL